MKKTKLSDVAALAGVSIATVSRVINKTGYVSEETKDSVYHAISTTGYKLSDTAEHPASNKAPAKDTQPQKLIGIILKKLSCNMYFEALNYAFLSAAEKKGMLAITVFCDDLNNATLLEQAKNLLSCHVAGLIISGFQDTSICSDVRSLLIGSKIPIVFVERLADSQGFNRVYVNNTLGGYLAAKHLIQNGHKKIIYIGRGYLDTDAGSRRMNGFLKAIKEATNPPEYVIKVCETSEPAEAYDAMKEASQELPGFTAVQAWYDGYLIGIMKYLNEQNLRVPNDIELIGQDNSYSRILVPQISSTCMPFDDMATAAVDIICDWQDTTREHFIKTINLEPKLIIR